MKKVSLVDIPLKQKARIIDVGTGKALHNRLSSLGIYPGREVVKVSQFAMKGPVAIKVGRSIIALGYGMAHKISVELV